MSTDKQADEKLLLVVDDDSSVRESMSALLDANVYSVQQAENGQRALELLKKMPHLPCLIVLDLAMPVMDGRGFLKLRAADPILQDIPVIVVSGNPSTGKRIEGIDAYLRKPVEVDRLMQVIDQHC